ncbi:hypothetical protein NIES4102_41170 (plasmid) [Chondrocystis sp. NIES-4102]|nr:hypothetical protein NIES4102_41170 [Chondrocystis sp. NIES-4102]
MYLSMKTLAIEHIINTNSIEYYKKNRDQFIADLLINLSIKIENFIMEEINLSSNQQFKHILLNSMNNNCIFEIAKEYITEDDFHTLFELN